MLQGINPISVPGSDGVLALYGGFTVCQISWSVAGTSDLILYDNPSAGSGKVVAVISHGTASGTQQIQVKPMQGLYAKNVTGWTATVWTD